MVQKIAFLILLIGTACSVQAITFVEADQLLQQQISAGDDRSEEAKRSQQAVVNGFWQNSGSCYKQGSNPEVQIIFQVSKEGNVLNVWVDQSSSKSECLKTAAKTLKFPVSKKASYFVKVQL